MKDERLAVHEAGHALVDYLQGVDVYHVTIEGGEGYEGRVRSEQPNYTPGMGYDHEEAKDQLRTLCAGMEAERLIFGDGVLDGSDREQVARLGLSNAPKNKEGIRDSSIFAEQAREMLEKHRSALEALAQFLLEERRISGSELGKFLDEQVD